jgi:hypothetical protein
MQAARLWPRATGVVQEQGPLQFSDVEALREMQAWRDCLKSAERSEVAAALAATAFAAKQLKALKLAWHPFPEKFLHGRTVVGCPEVRAGLALYVDELKRLHATARHSPDVLNRLAAPGLEILALSIQAVSQNRQLFVEGQNLWRELIRGVIEYPSVYRALIDPHAGAEEIADDLFLPAALIRI